jgi:hypothetical protein
MTTFLAFAVGFLSLAVVVLLLAVIGLGNRILELENSPPPVFTTTVTAKHPLSMTVGEWLSI